MNKLIVIGLVLGCAEAAFAQVPDHRAVVERVYAQGGHVLTNQDGAGRFIEAAASALFRIDPGFGHLRKFPPRTRCGDPPHACDVVLYRPTGQIIDLIVDMGEPGAHLGWSVGPVGEYGSADWFAPGITPDPQSQSALVTEWLELWFNRLEAQNRDQDAVIVAIAKDVVAAREELAGRQQLQDHDARLQQHDERPGWMKRFFGSPYGAAITAAVGTWLTEWYLTREETAP